MSSKLTIAGSRAQINFRYKCKEPFSAETLNGTIHEFKENTMLIISELCDDYAILQYISFPSREKILIKVDESFEHLEKLSGYQYS